LVVGKRSAKTIKERPHNIPLMFLGAAAVALALKPISQVFPESLFSKYHW